MADHKDKIFEYVLEDVLALASKLQPPSEVEDVASDGTIHQHETINSFIKEFLETKRKCNDL